MQEAFAPLEVITDNTMVKNSQIPIQMDNTASTVHCQNVFIPYLIYNESLLLINIYGMMEIVFNTGMLE